MCHDPIPRFQVSTTLKAASRLGRWGWFSAAAVAARALAWWHEVAAGREEAWEAAARLARADDVAGVVAGGNFGGGGR